MKIIHYFWGAYNDAILAKQLKKLGFDVINFSRECKHYSRDMELAAQLITMIKAENAEAVISFNYFPIISMVCSSCQIPYYSWIYDSPHLTLQAHSSGLPCNHIGIFDRKLCDYMDMDTCHHVPLAVDCEEFDKAIAESKLEVGADISFVGSLYTGQHNYYSAYKNNAPIWDEIDELVNSMCFSYSNNEVMSTDALPNHIYEYLNKRRIKSGLILDEDYRDCPEYLVMNEIIKKQITVVERRRLLTEIANKFGQSFSLFTGSDTSGLGVLDGVNKGVVDYGKDMPKVFNNSKINLNITLRTIESGIPLRALDIMGCGGFLLSNYQEELAEYFVDGKELVLYNSIDDCIEKINYYLSHEDERKMIAIAGRQKVEAEFNYRVGLERLFD